MVIVTDMRGRKVKGALTVVDEDSLSLATDGRTHTLARSEVSTVRVADGLGNGALIGAGAGLGAALGILANIGSGDGYVLPSATAIAPLLLSGGGALVGVWLIVLMRGAEFSMYRLGSHQGLSSLHSSGTIGKACLCPSVSRWRCLSTVKRFITHVRACLAAVHNQSLMIEISTLSPSCSFNASRSLTSLATSMILLE